MSREQFIQALQNNEIKDCIQILENMDFKTIRRDFSQFETGQLLRRGGILKEDDTYRNERKMVVDGNIIYYMMKFPNLELIEAFIDILRRNTNEEMLDLHELEIVSLFSSAIMYGLGTTEHLYIIMEIFGKDGFKILREIYDDIPLEFVYRKVVFDEYFTLGKIKRLFDKFDIINDEEIIQMFEYLEPMSGLKVEEYLTYISSISESVSIPSRLLQMIYDIIIKE